MPADAACTSTTCTVRPRSDAWLSTTSWSRPPPSPPASPSPSPSSSSAASPSPPVWQTRRRPSLTTTRHGLHAVCVMNERRRLPAGEPPSAGAVCARSAAIGTGAASWRQTGCTRSTPSFSREGGGGTAGALPNCATVVRAAVLRRPDGGDADAALARRIVLTRAPAASAAASACSARRSHSALIASTHARWSSAPSAAMKNGTISTPRQCTPKPCGRRSVSASSLANASGSICTWPIECVAFGSAKK